MAFLLRGKKMPCADTCRADLVSIERLQEVYVSVGCADDRNAAYRAEMEDAVCIANVALPSETTRLCLLGVFDGHGGRGAARWCGVHMPHLFAGALATALGPSDSVERVPSVLPAVLDAAFVHADKVLVPANGIRSGTTATVAVVSAVGSTRHVCVANVGDSGALLAWTGTADAVDIETSVDYAFSTAVPVCGDSPRNTSSALSDYDTSSESLARSEGATQLDANGVGTPSSARTPQRPASVSPPRAVETKLGYCVDLARWHRADEPNEVARVRSEGGVVFAQRVGGMLSVTRSLGDAELGPTVSARPSIAQVRLSEKGGTMWLMLACDGLWDVCTHAQAADVLLGLPPGTDGDTASAALVQFALDRGTMDNVSVAVARI